MLSPVDITNMPYQASVCSSLDLLKSKQGSKRDSSANESLTKNMPVSYMKVYLEHMPTRLMKNG